MSGAVVIVFVGVLVAVASLALAVGGAVSGPRRRLRKRADGLRQRRRGEGGPAPSSSVASVKRVEAKSRLAVADRGNGRVQIFHQVAPKARQWDSGPRSAP